MVGLALVEQRIPPQAVDVAVTDFFSRRWRSAWSAFLELEADGLEIDALSAADIIKRNGGDLTVAELTATTAGMVKVNEKIFVDKILAASYGRRRIRELFAEIEKVQRGEIEIENFKPQGSFKSLADILETDVKPALKDLSEGITHRIKTGFEKIDNVIGGGLSMSDVMVVAALTGAGKSAFVLQLATNIAKQNIPVAYVSGEMTDKENGLRLLSQAADFFNLNSVTHIDAQEHYFLNQWLEALKPLPIYFDSTTFDLQSLSKNLKHLVSQTGIKVLILDYLQLFKLAKNDHRQRTERIAEASQEVKRIAMEYGVAVVEVVQFNREGAKSLKTTMHDLEGSSQLEKDASLIFIIDREDDSSEVTLRIVKGRNTGKCAIPGTYKGMTLNFEF